MKALTIPTSRPSMRERMRTVIKLGSATVSNLRVRIDARASLATAITATVVLFACLGLMYVPGIVVSGLTAITCAALAPMADIDAPVDQEGGES